MKIKSPVILTTLLAINGLAHAQVLLKANGSADAYKHISSVLGGDACEVPDCVHPVKHITEQFDDQLHENVFVFHAHATIDNDRCRNFDRQRIEIKTYGPSAHNLKGEHGETVVYTWKFKLDSNFRAQPTFTHIHQIKAGDGDAGAPIITLTPRYGKPDELEVIHTGASKASSQGRLTGVPLADFRGTWVEVSEKLRYDTQGSYQITIKRVSDGKVLLAYSNDHIDLWRDGTSFCRPKWGIYRSLKSPSYIRDEDIRFADIGITELK
ncbi:polysaccharide lyase-like protein [Mucilaginibacter yixingensis]|uniref:Polysaccharide lyase-like protein n=1 Tax=Mucilaginibacter yixingensis TaxID=1295612 RepID=A0A2T5JGK0_9SPHI|nr:heparin lyase I family protein [Mucilaginibacter yixingensis]PTR01548.1 polysaccharide lyase-like protein [Mucilaginibacter yixingensis]